MYVYHPLNLLWDEFDPHKQDLYQWSGWLIVKWIDLETDRQYMKYVCRMFARSQLNEAEWKYCRHFADFLEFIF